MHSFLLSVTKQAKVVKCYCISFCKVTDRSTSMIPCKRKQPEIFAVTGLHSKGMVEAGGGGEE